MRIPIVIALVLVVGTCGLGVLAIGVLGWTLHKSDDARWIACGIGDRETRDIAVGSDGALYVAANGAGLGDVLVSRDACASFTPSGLRTEVVWSVSWLPSAGVLCAGTGDGLYCGLPSALIGPVFPEDVYWVVESGRAVAGGYPSIAVRDGAAFRESVRLSYASGGAAVSDAGILVGGDALRLSTDGGEHFTVVEGAPSYVSAIAARGAVVYAGGGSFASSFLHRSADGGRTFREVTMPGAQPEVLLLPTADPNVVVVGTHGVTAGDAWLSRDGGETWTALGCPGAEIHALALDDRFLYCGATSLGGARGMWRIPRADVGL